MLSKFAFVAVLFAGTSGAPARDAIDARMDQLEATVKTLELGAKQALAGKHWASEKDVNELSDCVRASPPSI